MNKTISITKEQANINQGSVNWSIWPPVLQVSLKDLRFK